MIIFRLIGPCLAAILLLQALPHAAVAATDDLQEILRLELAGEKLDAYLRLKELAPQGDPEIEFRLAGYYHYGWAGPASFKLAREWYGRAARQGHVDAMLGLAVMDAQGQGGPVDRKASFIWLTIASRLLKDPADTARVNGLRDKYKGELSTADLNAALSEAMAFQAVPEKN
jgi:TPR repeat protein